MAVYYNSTITVKGARDTALKELLVERENYASGNVSHEVFTSMTSSLPTNSSEITIPFGRLGTAQTIYMEYIGTLLEITLNVAGDPKLIKLNSGSATAQKRLLMEGVQVSGMTIRNRDATNEASYYLAMWGVEEVIGSGE